MRIEFVRTGGFSGLRLELSLDTNELDFSQASELEALVHDSGFFDLRLPRADRTPGADRLQYRLRISSPAGGDREAVLRDADVPQRLLPLLAHLTSLALNRREDSDPPVGAG